MITQTDQFISICYRAENLLAQVLHAPTHLEVLEQFESSHTVLRCTVQVQGDLRHVPATVILKQRSFDRPTNPDDFDQNLLFRNEWAALDFLSSHSAEARIGPRLYTSDYREGLVVLEDLGAVHTVQDVLYSPDRQAAEEALLGMGKTLGRLQRITYGRAAEFASRQSALGATSTICDSSLDCRTRMADLHACLAALNLESDPDFDDAIQEMESTIHGPGVFRAFVHHDAGPHNFVATGAGVQMLDFEFAGFGHGLLDVVCARLAFPPAFRGRVLPEEIVRQLEDAYRLELTGQVPSLGDDQVFNEAVAQACAHWAFSKLIGFWNGYLRERLLEGESRDTRAGRNPERSAFMRRQVFTYLRLALTALEQHDQLPQLRLALEKIVGRLLEIWPETPLLPGYPAFGGEPWRYP